MKQMKIPKLTIKDVKNRINKMLQKKFITLFIILLCFLSLCGCAKKEPSTILTKTTSKEISQLQKDIEKSTCENKESFIARLNSINTEVKSINEMCTLRYDSLKQENSKLKIVIGFLIFIIGSFIILKFKKIL